MICNIYKQKPITWAGAHRRLRLDFSPLRHLAMSASISSEWSAREVTTLLRRSRRLFRTTVVVASSASPEPPSSSFLLTELDL